jgi:hypothetical protein
VFLPILRIGRYLRRPHQTIGLVVSCLDCANPGSAVHDRRYTFGRESDRVGVRRRTRAQGQPEENKFENPWETTGNDDSDMLSRCDIHLAQETARHHIPTPKPTLGLVRAAHCALVGDNPPHLARTVARGHDLCASSVHPRTKGRSPRGRRRRGGHTCREPIRGVRVRIGREAASRRAVGRFRCRPPQHQVVARPG